MGLQFHETVYGRNYFQYQLPELTKQLKRIADALEDNSKAEPNINEKADEIKRLIYEKGSFLYDDEGNVMVSQIKDWLQKEQNK